LRIHEKYGFEKDGVKKQGFVYALTEDVAKVLLDVRQQQGQFWAFIRKKRDKNLF